MPQCTFYIDQTKQQPLSATWNSGWSNFRLSFRGEVICAFATKKELAAGRQFVTPDGKLLSVRLRHGLHPELELLCDGLPLQRNSINKRSYHSIIIQLALLMGALNIVAGAVAGITRSDIMLSIGLGYGSIAVGFVYILLAWGVRYLGSFAVFATTALIAVDMALLFVFTSLKDGPSSPLSGLLLKLFVVYAFLKCLMLIKNLRAQATATMA